MTKSIKINPSKTTVIINWTGLFMGELRTETTLPIEFDGIPTITEVMTKFKEHLHQVLSDKDWTGITVNSYTIFNPEIVPTGILVK